MNPQKHRRELHKIAEGGFFEFETSAYIKTVLSRLGCEIIPCGETGVSAYFEFGKRKTAAIRAELDALPIKEKTGLSFASETGYMHACGHDGNMAMLLSLCEKISGGSMPEYNVLAVFQPGEELIGGAASVISSGIFSQIRVDEMYALHLFPGLEKGKIHSRGGIICAGSSEVDLDFETSGGHVDSSRPGAVECAAEFLHYAKRALSAQGIFSNFGKICGGAARNISAPRAEIFGTLRYFSPDGSKIAGEILAYACEKLPCACRVAIRNYAPPAENSAHLFEKSRAEYLKNPILCADDFALYHGEVSEILYMLLGTGDTPPLHSDRFDFDESVLSAGVNMYERLLGV